MARDKRIRIQVRGVEEDVEIASERIAASKPPRGIKVTPGKRVSLLSARAAAEPVELKLDDHQLACVEYADGFKLWTRVDDLRDEFAVPAEQGTRGGRGEVWEIDPQRANPTRERGVGKVVVKALEFFDIDITAKTAEGLGGWFEDRQLDDRGAGLYRLKFGNAFGMTQVRGDVAQTDKPLLVFLHGTASSTNGSFGKLWDTPDKEREKALAALVAEFEDRIYALEHRTLTQSPIDNALELARKLPDKAELHLVSHSRGGLVGELLCLGERLGGREVLDRKTLDQLFAADADLSDLFGKKDVDKSWYADQRTKFDELLQVLDAKAFKVKRFVRVACPARGTTLASGRLDRWLSVLDYIGGETFAGDAIYFLLGVVKKRTDPRSLPGLEAMMPQSALVRLLNHPKLTVRSDLTVIAGDLQAGSLWDRVKYAVTDWFYAGDHDLVVNTGSMYGGLRRLQGQARHLFDQGAEVNHFRYFTNPETVRAMAFGLTGPDAQMGDFRPIAEAAHKDEMPAWRSAVARSATQGPRPVAIVLPGTMGSSLSVAEDRVWLEYMDIAFGGLEKLGIKAPNVSAGDLLGDFYGDFLVYLSRTHKVVPYAYDWRLSIQSPVDRLAELIERSLSDCELSGQPLHLVAHSMGGLVARLTLARNPQLWERMQALPGSCLMMLGTPNRGSHEALRWLTGFNPTLTKLRLLDVTNGRNGLLKIVSRYPGLLELLPAVVDTDDFADPAFWTGLRERLDEDWPLPDSAALRRLRGVWRELQDAPVDPQRMLYVAGCAPTTVNAYEVDPHGDSDVLGNPLPAINFFGTRRGDGTVTWDSGRLEGVATWYVEGAQHDELLSHTDAFPAYVDLLQSKRTSRLPDTEPQAKRGWETDIDRIPLPVEVPDSIPAETDLRGFVFGGGRVSGRDADVRLPRVRITVRHGDLTYANSPVCVGHYAGDTIVSAERALDRGLKGALAERAALGLYPGPIGSHHVFIHPDQHIKPGGAIVVGLGEVGSLTPGRLEQALVKAFLDYASEVARWPDLRFGPPNAPRHASINCLLIGTGFDNMTVRDSVTVILRAVRIANERLHKNELDDKVLIDHLTLLELYEDVAIVAARDLALALDTDEFSDGFDWPVRQLESGVGGHRRVMFEEAPNWWHRLEIVYSKKQEALRYYAFTDRARVEESLVAGDMRLADDFIRDALATTRDDPAIAKTLFEMLVPNRIKEQAPDQRDMVLVVDEVSARFPWELMQDRWSHDGKPLAVAAGMLRQLKVQEQQERPTYSMGMNALVVGDPDLGSAEPMAGRPVFSQLPGARAEAETVVAVFGTQGYGARSVIGGSSGEILTALHDDGYRILHLAGHGVHEFLLPPDESSEASCDSCQQPLPRKPKRISGMVIGTDRFLTPGDVRQMRVVPELVFINCCHLGRTQSDLHMNELAANLGVQFIRMGVRAVIAAGWAVDDAAAKRFAKEFYQCMFRGDNFGDAVRAAREAVWSNDRGTNTWGAYQCYGDPGYRLIVGRGSARSERQRDFVSPSELVVELRNLTSRVKTSGTDKATITWLLETLDGLLDRIPANLRDAWLGLAKVGEALGIVYGELGMFEQAIAHLDKALEGEKALLSVAAIEQRANFVVREAVERAMPLLDDAAGDDKRRRAVIADADRQIGDAIAGLERLCGFASTAEREALLGGAYKRRSLVAPDEKSRLKWLGACAEHYAAAHRHNSEEGQLVAYPLIQWLSATALEQITAAADKRQMPVDDELSERIDSECLGMVALAAEQEMLSPDFWNTAVPTDCEVLKAVAGLDFGAHADRIVDGYLGALRRGGSPRELRSVVEHLAFVRDMFAAKAEHAGRATRSLLADQVTAIDGIIERLEARQSDGD